MPSPTEESEGLDRPNAPGLAGLERTVHSSAIFHECSYEFVEAIMLQIRKILLHPGKVLVKEEDAAPRSMYFVLFGTLDIYRLDQKIGSLTSGGVLGEGVLLGILDSWSYTVVARDSCMLAEMTSGVLGEVLQEHPEEAEYFEALLEYFAIRKEELEENEDHLRQSLRRMPCLRQVSEEFLQAIEKGLVHQLYFSEQCILTEGQDSSFAAFLSDGEVVVEAAQRAVRREEVPFVEFRFTMNPEADSRASMAESEEGRRGQSHRRASRKKSMVVESRRSGEDVAVESLISLTNKARTEAMIAEAVAGGLTPGYDVNALPEAAPFGEECLLGLGPSSVTVSVCKLSVVLLLHRAVFEQLLQDFPKDLAALSRFQPEMLPKPNFQDLPICQHVDMSNELLDFFARHVERRIFFPGDNIEPDNVQIFLPKQLLNPASNITYAIVSSGHVRVKTPPGLELAPFGHLSSGDILGPGSILPGSWFWSSVKVQALQICFVTVLHCGVIARGLEEMPREREKVLPLLVRENTGNPNVAQQVRSSERVAKILRERSIFANTSQEFLAEILNFGTVRVFMPGDRILQQGAEGNSMFILSLGLAQVVKETLEELDGSVVRNLYFIGGLTYGSVFGELVMLGVQSKRTASIVASSTCCTWEAEVMASEGAWASFWGDAQVPAQSSHGTCQQVVLARTEGQVFRERVGFVVLCIIGAYCSMRILVELRSILEPFLWALFLVMAWKPVVDGIESRLELLLAFVFPSLRVDPPLKKGLKGHDSDDEMEDMEGELESMLPPQSDSSPMMPEVLPRELRRPRNTGNEFDEPLTGGSRLRRNLARGLAVLMASAGMLGLLSGFGLLIMESARHMQNHWDVYQKGADQLTKDLLSLFSKVPESFKKQYQEASADMVKSTQDLFYSLLGNIVNNVSSLIFGVLLTMLYTLFWLCSPVPMDSSVDVMFRKYIMFKTLACFGYGISAGLLLYFLSIDLASVFALTTFALNFVPEVGPFIAMVLPCPVILFDSRLERPMLTLLTAIIGQLALKFSFSNVIEVKLIESDKKLRMHPVMILLSVGIFGYLWGPTGMLLSVPLMALMKIALFSELVPSSYRDPILVILEGDRSAPQKHGLKASSKRCHGAVPGG